MGAVSEAAAARMKRAENQRDVAIGMLVLAVCEAEGTKHSAVMFEAWSQVCRQIGSADNNVVGTTNLTVAQIRKIGRQGAL